MTKYILAAALTVMLPVAASSAATEADVVAAATMTDAKLGDANLIGHVVDAETGDHLPYYTIKILDTEYITVTDATGHYSFTNLEPGRYKVEASSVGYTPLTREVDIRLATTAELNFDVSADAFMLEQVVVTGSKSEQKRRNSPALLSVVNSKLFNLVNACSLADGLNFQPGVRVENDCQNCGFTQVRINGLDGHYSQILMNSRPVFSALAGVYGLEQIPANMIERVEVMRGGGSALFGSSAIGGTVNIITRDPMSNSAEVSHTLMSIGISGALDNNTTLNASVVGANGKIGALLYGQNRNRNGYDHNGDGFTEVAQLKTQTIGVRGYARPTQNQRLTLEYHATHEYRRGGDQLDVEPDRAWVAEQVEHNINCGEVSYDLWSATRDDHLNLFGAVQGIKRKSYYGSEMDPNAYGRTTDLVATAGAQWTHNFARLLFMPSEFIAGAEYYYNYLHDVTLGYDHDALQRVNIYSGYLQNEWRNDRWGFLIGARLDKHSMISNVIVSPRANIRYNPSQNVNLRLSYSSGFRAPQAYDEDFHVAVVGGERVVTVLAPDLREESSHSISASADFYFRVGTVNANVMIEGFYTDLSDVFALRRLEELDAQGNAVLERYNGSGARVGGVNVEGKAIFTPRWQLQAGVTWQQSRYKSPEAWSEDPAVAPVTRLFRTPDVYGYLTLNCGLTRGLSASVSATYTGSMPVQHLAGSGTPVDCVVNTPAFFDAGVKLSYEFKVFGTACIDTSIGITNLFGSYQKDFDSGYLRDSGYIYGPALPRSLTASVKVHI